jgi:hypothetical protein
MFVLFSQPIKVKIDRRVMCPWGGEKRKRPARATTREAGNVRAGSLASPVEWVLGLSLEFLKGVKPQVTQEGHITTHGPVWGTE